MREVDALASAVGAFLQRQQRAGAVLAAGCSGGFVLGRCGVLDGKVATTSWWLVRTFEREFPKARLRADELVTSDGRVLCAGPAILTRIGYADEASFRRTFKRHTSLSPREYRRRFAIGRVDALAGAPLTPASAARRTPSARRRAAASSPASRRGTRRPAAR